VVMRKVCIRYAALHPHSGDAKRAFIAARTSRDVEGAIGRWYDPGTDWPPVRRRERVDAVAAGAIQE